MVEVLILHSLHVGASRLEYRTIEGEFRVAQIIDQKAYEYPQPPDCMRQPTIEYLKTIFELCEGTGEASRTLCVGKSQAKFRCTISENDSNAIIEFVEPFSPPANFLEPIQGYFKACALKKGMLAYANHVTKTFFWNLMKIMNRLRPSVRAETRLEKTET